MTKLKSILLALTLAPAPLAAQTVTIADGTLRGTTADGVTSFKGIPYAAAPVGPRRWTAPAAPARWTGVRDATRFGASCAQATGGGGFGPWTHEYVVGDATSEDCLFLNVWTPAHRPAAKMPVMVWIHGGGFNAGSGSVPVYDGAGLAARGVVVVNINYRLGVFGFLAYPELTREGVGSGEFGLLDMIAALRWVRANIAAFGGDPARVTIAGQSAGAAAVHDLIASPMAKGLFSRAIAESGSGVGMPTPPLAIAEKTGLTLAGKVGATSLAQLRALPAETLVKAGGGDPTRPDALHFAPAVDGHVLPADPGAPDAPLNATPVLTGLNRDEGSAGPGYGHATPADLKATIDRRFGAAAPQAVALYPATDATTAGEAAKQVTRDGGIAGSYVWATRRAARSNQPLFLYYDTNVEPGPQAMRYGAFHTSEVPYVFDAFGMSPERPFTAADRKLSDTMQRYWVNFMSKGDPNGPGLPVWPRFDPAKPMSMELGPDPRPVAELPPAKLDFYRSYLNGGGKVGLF